VNPDTQYALVARKRAWVPEWLYLLYAHIPPWVQPFRWVFNKEVKS
jgi:hypothetical protein